MVEEEVDIGVLPGLPTHDGAEHIKMLDAKPSQLGLVFVETMDRFFASHG
jgi:hypothetical protein